MLKKLSFKGGVHPDDGKRLAKDKAIVELKPVGDLVYPVSQHIGAPASPIVAVGDKVKKGQVIAILEAMKLENEVVSTADGTVKQVLVNKGQAVTNQQVLVIVG